jgi:Bacterial protein of unknown function (DUF894).
MKNKWIKKVILFLTGQTITLFGSSLVQFAISWHMTLTTKSGTVLMISTLCGFLPQVIISPFSGVLADRFDRKKLIMLADGMIAFFTLGLFIAFSLGYQELWLLYLISAIRSAGSGIQTPAVSALLPDLVPEEKLMKVNGLNASIQSVMMLLAPAAAGGLYSAMGLQSVFLVDVVTAVIGIGILAFVKVQRKAAAPVEQITFFEDMKVGLRYVKMTKWLKQYMLFYLVYALMYGPVVFLTPLMVARSFGEEPWRLVAHETVFALGMIGGGFSISLLGDKFKNKSLMVIWACALFGVETLIMGFSKTFVFYLGAMLPMGLTLPYVNTGTMTVLQLKTDPPLMGRVFGMVSVIGSAAMPLSMAIFGPLADVVSVEAQLIITGVLMVIVSLFMLRCKEMIEAGIIAPKEAPQPPAHLAQNE